MKEYGISALILYTFITCSCSEWIEYSPFDANVRTLNINGENISRITAAQLPEGDTLKFVVFSDVHENYDDMSDALASINRLPGISFVVCNGDVTNEGLAQEFKWYADVIKESEYPFLTVIGNHDCLANGQIIFERMFGPHNISFTTGGYKFILFNNIIWENNNNSPRYEWLRDELKGGNKNIIISHMPPVAIDVGDLHRIVYNQIADSTNTFLAIHASAHNYSEFNYNGIHILISTEIKDREYYLIKIFDDQFTISRVKF